MRQFLIVLLLVLVASSSHGAFVYKWVDQAGGVHFTDDFNKVPLLFRDQVEVKEYLQEGGSPLYPQETTFPKREEAKVDIYGRDEAWWKEKVHPYKKQLREAENKYEMARQAVVEKAQELSQMRFMSRTQVKMKIIELDRANEELVKWEYQTAEAGRILDDLSREAMEARADPEWLN